MPGDFFPEARGQILGNGCVQTTACSVPNAAVARADDRQPLPHQICGGSYHARGRQHKQGALRERRIGCIKDRAANRNGGRNTRGTSISGSHLPVSTAHAASSCPCPARAHIFSGNRNRCAYCSEPAFEKCCAPQSRAWNSGSTAIRGGHSPCHCCAAVMQPAAYDIARSVRSALSMEPCRHG